MSTVLRSMQSQSCGRYLLTQVSANAAQATGEIGILRCSAGQKVVEKEWPASRSLWPRLLAVQPGGGNADRDEGDSTSANRGRARFCSFLACEAGLSGALAARQRYGPMPPASASRGEALPCPPACQPIRAGIRALGGNPFP